LASAVGKRVHPETPSGGQFRYQVGRIIFETDTLAGRVFDVVLLWAILLSVTAACLESVASIREDYGTLLRAAEWVFTALFSVEYLLRLICAQRRLRYAVSFFGVVDLLAVLPTYLSLVVPNAQALIVIRALRLLRVFRVLKLGRYVEEAAVLVDALRSSRPKITVFLFAVVTIVIIVGTVMYLIEGQEAGFTSIPMSMYWAVVTLTTVGFGDITPLTTLGKTLASLLMITGYGIIAVPTGIVTFELANVSKPKPARDVRECPSCARRSHDADASFCRFCGADLEGDENEQG